MGRKYHCSSGNGQSGQTGELASPGTVLGHDRGTKEVGDRAIELFFFKMHPRIDVANSSVKLCTRHLNHSGMAGGKSLEGG